MHRNKYNTMTPAEAKKLNRYLSGVGTQNYNTNNGNSNTNNGNSNHSNANHSHRYQPGRPPVRTASVLHKPRAPPIIVTNLDDYGLPATNNGNKSSDSSTQIPRPIASNGLDDTYVNLPRTSSRPITEMPPFKYLTLQTRTSNRNSSVNANGASGDRCASSCSNNSYSSARYQRHSINLGSSRPSYGYGPSGANGLTMTTINSINNNGNGNGCSKTTSTTAAAATTTATTTATQQLGSKGSPTNDSESNLSFRSSLDIIDSAYGSDRFQTMSVDLGNPHAQNNNNNTNKHHFHLFTSSLKNGAINSNNNNNRYNNNNNGNNHDQYCDPYGQEPNKLSDESYCSAVSQQAESVKSKLKSVSKLSLTSSTSRVFQNQLTNLKRFFRYIPNKRSEHENSNGLEGGGISDKKTFSGTDLGESISQFCLDRSQSPPVCPPPPGELKSMSYMESSVNYSNYDEFTKARNEQTSALLTNNHLNRNSINGRQAAFREQQQHGGNCNQAPGDDYSLPGSEDTDSWHLASLPVSYERNLTTVFEEKPNNNNNNGLSRNLIRASNKTTTYLPQITNNENSTFKEEIASNGGASALVKEGKKLIKPPANFDDKGYETAAPNIRSSASNTNSTQSLNSITSDDSVLDFHRQTNSSFRFSYGQPNAFDRGTLQRNTGLPPRMPTAETKMMTNGNSTPNSNGANTTSNNNCETDKTSSGDRLLNDSITVPNGLDIDLDSTILSDTSTINGDSNHINYVNKCAELASTIESLKSRLIAKEKELTDMQLKLWSSDFFIDSQKQTINRLEKENAQLKMVAAKAGNKNQCDVSTYDKVLRQEF